MSRRLLPPLLLVLAGPFACAPESARPDVVLVSVDTLRPDHLGCYGYGRDTSPFLDALAARGVRFENAFAQASWTLPSHMSLLTSRYPWSHQVERQNRSLPDSIPTLAEAFQAAGYETTAFVSWIYVLAKFGFDRGFDAFHELLPPKEHWDSGTRYSIKAGAFADRVAEWSDGAPRRPFFLFLHLFDPHMDYEPPLELARRYDPELADVSTGAHEHLKRYIRGLSADAERVPPDELERARALYDGEIRYVDRELGRVFAALDAAGLLENAVIAFTSDHGEEFDEHGSMEGHQWTLYDEVLRVPLLLVLPADRYAGTVVPRIVQSIDVAPTLLDAAGVAFPDGFEGRSLLALCADPDAPWTERAFGRIRRFNVKWSLRTPAHKLIFTRDTGTNRWGVPVEGGYELYDLRADPGEQSDVFDPELARDLVRELEDVIQRKRTVLDVPEPVLSDEELEALRALGYGGD